jgi:hypothetical protein
MKKTFQNIVNEDLTEYLKDIRANTLIIWGNEDTDTPLKDGIKMNKLISNSELIILKDTNHYAYLGREYLVSEIINKQLERIEKAKSDIIAILASKGINVPADTKISDLAPYINALANVVDLTKGDIVNG